MVDVTHTHNSILQSIYHIYPLELRTFVLKQSLLLNRWVEEGHISLRTSKKFLPENAKVTGEMEKFIEMEHLSYVKGQMLMSAICNQLDIESLPMPDLCSLAERYCTELQLPGKQSSGLFKTCPDSTLF